MINKQSYQITGMRQDNLVSTGFSSKFAHEIMNMRFNTIGDYTTASWTTEKGTLKVNVENLEGYKGGDVDLTNFKPLGQANINDVWVLFGKLDVNEDAIVKFKYEGDTLRKALLYRGDLKFNLKYPIETLTFFENDSIQKVYWTDGINQPRVINIAVKDVYDTNYETQFDFVQEVSLNEEVEITKENSGTGLFPPCTVKYCLTYYHQYGSESNIVYESPLYYPTLGNRACSPDELSGDNFKVTVSNIDSEHGFDFIRLYSIIRTSDNATPIVRIVEDKSIKGVNSVTFLDTNTKGIIIDPTILNYIGGRAIIAETLNQKNNTLFLGNIKLAQDSLQSVLHIDNNEKVLFNNSNTKKIPIKVNNTRASFNKYQYINQLNTLWSTLNPFDDTRSILHYGNSNEIKIFKYGEWYRFGIQAQDYNGVWSDVVYISDSKNSVVPVVETDLFGYEYYKVGKAVFTLNSIKSSALKSKYKKVRLVCCYPTNADRSRIAQGVITSTLYTEKEREDHCPDCMSSWWFRPFKSDGFILDNNEVQSQKENEDDKKYKINTKVWTLNSPDVELDESIRTLDARAFKVEPMGVFQINLSNSSMYIDATPATSVSGTKGSGLSKKTISTISTSINFELHPMSYKWRDYDVYYPHGLGSGAENYRIYPFQRDILNNYIKEVAWYNDNIGGEGNDFVPVTIKETAKINTKVNANLLYSKTTEYMPTDISTRITEVSSVNFFDSLEAMPVVLDSDNIYYGNVNTIAQVNTDNLKTKGVLLDGDKGKGISSGLIKALFTGSYTIEINNTAGTSSVYDGFNYRDNGTIERYSNNSTSFVSSDPIKIAYKSTPHVVFKATVNSFVDYEDSSINERTLYIADVTRDVSNAQRFGGVHTDVNRNNVYVSCGPAVDINENGTTIYGLEGDHYLMRYDCLKTYPYTTEDSNQIVEIASYFTETRINLDGRYDKNRGNVDNTLVLPTNFNLINKSYTQNNNFFSYIETDNLSADLNSFDNQFTWTKEKVSGEDVDAWTNITLASTADADGTLGKINRIINLNDNLMLFQDHGLAKIEFNESTAISTENGLPLELAKTGKYTGLNYITREIGCQNKWSISLTKNGLSWIDDSRQEILKYTNEGIQPLSSLSGFDAFMIKELPSPFKVWNPDTFDNFVTYYDKLSNDIYYINKNYCLAWNELSQTFTSFYNYEEVPYMVNIGQHSLMWKDKVYAAREGNSYNTFFGNLKDYWITLVCDGQTDKGSAFPADKVFNNIEYRADVYNIDGNNTNYATSVFNKQHVWNGYQDSHECNLDGIRKFNTWRVQLPRHYGTRDRIRNPFCYIKLKQDQSMNTQTDRMILHDLAVYFDMK